MSKWWGSRIANLEWEVRQLKQHRRALDVKVEQLKCNHKDWTYHWYYASPSRDKTIQYRKCGLCEFTENFPTLISMGEAQVVDAETTLERYQELVAKAKATKEGPDD